MRIGIGFDIDHTLLIDNKLERIAFMRLLESVIKDRGHPIGTLAEEQDRIDNLLNRQRHAGRSIEETIREFVNAHLESAETRDATHGGDALLVSDVTLVSDATLASGVTAAGVEKLAATPSERQYVGRYKENSYVEQYKRIALGLVDQVVIPIPGVRETLTELRARGIALAILTNGWNPLQERKARRVGFPGPLVVSSEIGIQKPDPQAFAALLQVLDVPRESAWYVGDDPTSDIAGARNAGLKAIWLDAESHTYPPELPPPTHTIHSLEEILTLF